MPMPHRNPIDRWSGSLAVVVLFLAGCPKAASPVVEAPSITVQPTSVTETVGHSATFLVAATGTPPPTYQWQRSGTPIASATSPIYRLDSVQAADSGAAFSVTVTNGTGSVTSAAATLTVLPVTTVAPVITSQPQALEVLDGDPATFVVLATGTAPLAYQWSREGLAIAGATSAVYTLSPAHLTDAGVHFSVVVSNGAGQVTSDPAMLTVHSSMPPLVAPAITTQPGDRTVLAGDQATFAVVSTGTAPLTYQWRRNGTALAGAVDPVFTTQPSVPGDDGAGFDVVVKNEAGTVTSTVAKLTVLVPPGVTAQPVSVSVPAGQSATFSVQASGTPAPSYQWRRQGVAVVGATSASYTLASVGATDDGASFDVVVTNSAGSVTSAPAVLSVTAQLEAPWFGLQPASVTVGVGSTATFSVRARGTSPLTYQWRRGGVALAGATAASFTTPPTTSADDQSSFDVVVANGVGTSTSAAATLTVVATVVAPTLIGQPQAASVFAGQQTTFTVVSSGTRPFTYQWLRGGANLVGATEPSYTLTPQLADDGARLTVRVGNAAGSVLSTEAILGVAPSPGTITLLAGDIGGLGGNGNRDGLGVAARIVPVGLAVDDAGNLYMGDTSGRTIRKISRSGVVTTLAGSPGHIGSADGIGPQAQFYSPVAVAVDGSGNVYVAEQVTSIIRKVTPDGIVTTLAGTTYGSGSSDGTGAMASFNAPRGIAVSRSGIVYVADTGNDTIRKITPAGVVTTIAGSPGVGGSLDAATGALAQFDNPQGLVVDPSGALFVADTYNCTIRKIALDGSVSTVAGTAGNCSSTDGSGSTAALLFPRSLALDSNGNLLAADRNAIRLLSPSGALSTLATPPAASGYNPGITGLAVRLDAQGNRTVLMAEPGLVQSIDVNGAITTVAGARGVSGASDGVGAAASFSAPRGLAADKAHNLYVADQSNQTIRRITPNGTVSTFAGAAGLTGSTDATGAAARFFNPTGVAVDAGGNVFVADAANATLRRITQAGVVTTLAGTAGTSAYSDGDGSSAQFVQPMALATDLNGYLLVIDDTLLRKVVPSGLVTVTTVAGQYNMVGATDGTGSAAQFYSPQGVAIDSAGNAFVADTGNDTIRKVTPAGVVSTFAGTAGVPSIAGSSDGVGAAARFNMPTAIAIDPSDNLYVADTRNQTVRKITPAGVVTTVVGVAGVTGVAPGPLPGGLSGPFGLVFDGGALYVSTVTCVVKVTFN
jgi:sugar lactone lactonase YvrE